MYYIIFMARGKSLSVRIFTAPVQDLYCARAELPCSYFVSLFCCSTSLRLFLILQVNIVFLFSSIFKAVTR